MNRASTKTTAANLQARFDAREDVLDYFDLESARVVVPPKKRVASSGSILRDKTTSGTARGIVKAVAFAMGTTSVHKKAFSKRGLIAPKGDKRFVRRNKKGEFKNVVSVGRSLSADKRQRAKTKVAKGQGKRRDTKR